MSAQLLCKGKQMGHTVNAPDEILCSLSLKFQFPIKVASWRSERPGRAKQILP